MDVLHGSLSTGWLAARLHSSGQVRRGCIIGHQVGCCPEKVGAYTCFMSELLKKALEAVTKLSDADQDEVARMMLAMSSDAEVVAVPAEHIEAVSEGLQQARGGRLASEEVKAVWRRFDP
jgi:hypothetical protein